MCKAPAGFPTQTGRAGLQGPAHTQTRLEEDSSRSPATPRSSEGGTHQGRAAATERGQKKKKRQLADGTDPGQLSSHSPGAHGSVSQHLLATLRALWPHERVGTESPGPGMWRLASGRARAPGGPALPWTPAERPHWTHRQKASPLSPAWVGTAPSAERQKAPVARRQRPALAAQTRGGSCVQARRPGREEGPPTPAGATVVRHPPRGWALPPEATARRASSLAPPATSTLPTPAPPRGTESKAGPPRARGGGPAGCTALAGLGAAPAAPLERAPAGVGGREGHGMGLHHLLLRRFEDVLVQTLAQL